MLVTNLDFKIKKKKPEILIFFIFIHTCIHTSIQLHTYILSYIIHSFTSIHAHQSVIQSMDRIEVACSSYYYLAAVIRSKHYGPQ
jgi:flagellar biosynthesis protein FliR